MSRRRWMHKAACAAMGLALLAPAGAGGPARAGTAPGAQPEPAAGQEEGRVRLELVPEAEVSGPVIRLEDVARLVEGDGERWARLRTIAVGAAPLPGEQRTLPLAWVRAGLRRVGVDPRTVQWVEDPALAVVRRQVAWLDPEVVRDAIDRYLAGRASGDGRLAGQPGQLWPLAVGSLEWDGRLTVGVGPVAAEVVAAPPVLRPGPAVFSVEIQSPGMAARRVWVRATLQAASSADPHAASTPAAAGGGAAGPEAPTEQEGAGSAAPVEAQGGQVEAGAPVLLLATRGPLTASVPAVLRSGGRVGTVVEVVNGLSGQVVAALLVSEDRAVAVGPVQASGGGDR